MGRPVRKRTEGYASDMTALARLALAIKMDARIDAKVGARVVKKLDDLLSEFVLLNHELGK